MFIGLKIDEYDYMPVKTVANYTEAINISGKLNTEYGDYYLIDVENNVIFPISKGELNSNKINFMNKDIKIQNNFEAIKKFGIGGDKINE